MLNSYQFALHPSCSNLTHIHVDNSIVGFPLSCHRQLISASIACRYLQVLSEYNVHSGFCHRNLYVLLRRENKNSNSEDIDGKYWGFLLTHYGCFVSPQYAR